MKLIIGGAYQGKLDYVLGRFGYTRDDVHLCTMGEAALNTDKPVIRGLEKWIFAMLEAKRDPVAGIEELLPALRDRIVICTDLSGGVVPVDPDMRAWREAAGRVTVRLAQDADEVVRLFCGIPTRLK